MHTLTINLDEANPSRHMEDTICHIAVDMVDTARDIVQLLEHLQADFQFSHYPWKTTDIYRHYEGQLGGSISARASLHSSQGWGTRSKLGRWQNSLIVDCLHDHYSLVLFNEPG